MLAELRDVLNAAGTGVTWSDTQLLGYLAEGQDKFCEETGYFIDKTNYTITLATGTRSYAIPDRVIQVLEVFDGTRKLTKLLTGNDFDYIGYYDGTVDAITSGDPGVWTTDVETGKIEFDRAPTATENGSIFTLKVWRYSRYPLDRMSSTVTLAGSLHAGDVIAVTVNGVAYSYAVLGSEATLSVVATALAAVIDAAAALVATASGQVISIASAETGVSTTTTVVVSGAGATVTATAADAHSAAPEILARFQRACIEWAAYKAFNHHDIEAQDPVKAVDHLRSFKMYITDAQAAFRRYHNIETRVGCDPAYVT